MENQTENQSTRPTKLPEAVETEAINILYHLLGAGAVSPEAQREYLAGVLATKYKAGFEAGVQQHKTQQKPQMKAQKGGKQ